MAVLQQDIAAQMIQQLRMLDPSVSAEIGTPERKIIDTMAQGLSDAQVDLDGLSVALDVDSKYGADLDRFLAIFGFARIGATYARGYVTFARSSAANIDISIPSGTRVRGYSTDNQDFATYNTDFVTQYGASLGAGETEVVVPVQAVSSGSIGNLAGFTITQSVGTPLYGITEFYNETPTTGGRNPESDNEYKVRFKNTVFRNVSGTRDQYLALSISLPFVTKANVVGPQSKYTEYIQVPPVDDTRLYDVNGNADKTISYDIDGNVLESSTDIGDSGDPGGNNPAQAGDYTTALSTIPFAKEIWTSLPVFITNGLNTGSYFYRPEVDFKFNIDPIDKNRGDALRLFKSYGNDIEIDPLVDSTHPNVTFSNVYDVSDEDDSVQAIRPNDIVLLEYTYLSNASRNSLQRNITNAVDVYIDGVNETSASTVVSRPNLSSIFVDDVHSPYYIENFRRIGEPERRPNLGNVCTPLFWQPVVDLPDAIIVNDVTYYKNQHYWVIEDVSDIGGTIRSRSGIEWSATEYGQRATDTDLLPEFTGPIPIDNAEDALEGLGPNRAPIEIDNYFYDQNITNLQSSLESARQITTDVLAHQARPIYLKFDFTIMYSGGISDSSVDLGIGTAIDQYLQSLYFGSVLQLSDIIQVAHGVSEVDNIRWSSDIPGGEDLARIYYTDINGAPLCGVEIYDYESGRDEILPTNIQLEGEDDGSAFMLPARNVTQHLAVSGQPTRGYFTMKIYDSVKYTELQGAPDSKQIRVNGGTTREDLQGVIQEYCEGIYETGVSVSIVPERSPAPVVPQMEFRITLPSHNAYITITESTLSGGPYVIENDFFVKDNEVARIPDGQYSPPVGIPDGSPGIISRARSQGTWVRS